jgi:hypothetical protein
MRHWHGKEEPRVFVVIPGSYLTENNTFDEASLKRLAAAREIMMRDQALVPDAFLHRYDSPFSEIYLISTDEGVVEECVSRVDEAKEFLYSVGRKDCPGCFGEFNLTDPEMEPYHRASVRGLSSIYPGMNLFSALAQLMSRPSERNWMIVEAPAVEEVDAFIAAEKLKGTGSSQGRLRIAV